MSNTNHMTPVKRKAVSKTTTPIKVGPTGTVSTLRIPAPKLSGNKGQDELAKTKSVCLTTSINDLLTYDSLVMPVFDFIQKEKRKIVADNGIVKTYKTLASCTTFATMEENFRIAHLTNRSDLTETDVLHILKTDESGLNDLIQFDIQTSMKLKCPRELLVSDVCKLYFAERHLACGSRLADFKKKGGFQDKVIQFNKVCSYVVTFDADGDLKTIKHISGDIKNITMKTGLTKGHLLNDNFDDYQAMESSLIQQGFGLASKGDRVI